MEQLRDIVFGAAKRHLEQRIDKLEDTMRSEFETLRQHQSKQYTELKDALEAATASLSEQLAAVDDSHSQKSEQLNGYADRLASSIEMAESAGKDDAHQLNERLDLEVRTLTKNFNDKYADAMRKLEQVTQELGSTKTDRKTLAKLLSTVALNLETDENAE